MTDCNILFLAAGRRVSLLNHFRITLDTLGIKGKVIAADASMSAPGKFVGDEYLRVPKVSDAKYIPFLLQYCKKKNIRLLTSLIDTDLELLSRHSEEFLHVGTTLLGCNQVTNRICGNKLETNKFFLAKGILTPHVYSPDELEKLGEENFPLLIKPWDGSSSQGVTVIGNQRELDFFYSHVPNAMVQEYLNGDEYTCDVYAGLSGDVRCVVPRKRLETRAGEVSKGVTVRDDHIIEATKVVVEHLPNAMGCITVQCIKEPDGKIKFIEINPRFGGGIPLSLHAGADFPKWIIQEIMGMNCEANMDSWTDDLVMLRYDDAIFVRGEQIR